MGNPLIPPCDPRYLRGLKDPPEQPSRKEKKLEAFVQEQFQKGYGVCRDPQSDEFRLYSIKDTQKAETSSHLVNLFGEPVVPSATPPAPMVPPSNPLQPAPASSSWYEDPFNVGIVAGAVALIGTVAGLIRHYRKRPAAVAAQPEPKSEPQPEAKPEAKPEPQPEPKPEPKPALPEVNPPPRPQNQGLAEVLAGLTDLHVNELMNLPEYRDLDRNEKMRVLRAIAEGDKIQIDNFSMDATERGEVKVQVGNREVIVNAGRTLPVPNVSLTRQEYERAVVQLRNAGAKNPEAWAQELTVRRSLHSPAEWKWEILSRLGYDPNKSLPDGESPLPLKWIESFDVAHKDPVGGAIFDATRTRVMAAVKPPPLPALEPVDESFEGRKTVVLPKAPVVVPAAAPKPGLFGRFFGGIADGFRSVGRFFARLNPFARKPAAPKAEAQPKPEPKPASIPQPQPQPEPQPVVIDPEVRVLMENIRAVEPAAFEGLPEADLQVMAEQVREMRINGVFEGMIENGVIKPEGLRLALRMAKAQAVARGVAPGSEAERRDKESRENKGPMDALKGGRVK